ncbi:MAG TPA: class I SAM-dependent methyltransferase [Urbifossiella sp.]|nr:class I SAM-dependent methyltransferase [Urbifossiella sp.]
MAASDRYGQPLAFADLLRSEDRHFWFRARNGVLSRVVRGVVRGWEPGYRVLEVGCGNGYVLRMLEAACPGADLTGSELFPEAVANAAQRVRCRVVQADVYHLPPADPYRLIGMFDVLEHLPDDAGALRGLRAATTPGGRLVLTVPAYMTLWSHTDEAAGHYRRYTPTTLRAALVAAGWQVEYVTPFMLPLVPLMWLGRKVAAVVNRLRGRRRTELEMAVGELRPVPVVNGLMRALLAPEAPLIGARWRLPVGTSLLAVASNPTPPAAAVAA